MRIEPRQHELFGVDLGEGVPRAALGWGVMVYLAWWVLLSVLRVPWIPPLVALWMVPPSIFAWLGWQEGRCSRRRRVTDWMLSLRWIVRAHQPVIGLGRRQPDREECLPVRERIRSRTAGWQDVLRPGQVATHRTYTGPRQSIDMRQGRAVLLAPRVQLIGTEEARARLVRSRQERRK
ncbi:hypothetical protein [Mobilicoccus caccae]|nr:hypothetical protein [Mobilicoccus caccae]